MVGITIEEELDEETTNQVILDYSQPGTLQINMKYYIESMIKDFPHRIGSTSIPWTDKLFKVKDNDKLLDEERSATFHTFVMKAMFLCKRARPDIELELILEASKGEVLWLSGCQMLPLLSILI